MNRILMALATVLVFGLVSLDAEAQRRMGGGRNLGKQRPAPTMQEAQKAPTTPPASQQAASPAKPATAGAATGAAARPSFMQRWGGLLAGLGIGALLASLFGEQLGPIIGMLLMGLLVAAAIMLLLRLFGRRGPPEPAVAGAARMSAAASPGPTQFRGIGSALNPPVAGEDAASARNRTTMERRVAPEALAESEIEPFLRVAKTSFIRLQAAHDAGDLDDIRDYTTPELYAEIAMQVQERGGEPQRVEVVSLDARLVEAVVEGDYAIATVRFTGLVRENDAANPVPVDELWHVRKDLRQRKGPWLIAGIQQVE